MYIQLQNDIKSNFNLQQLFTINNQSGEVEMDDIDDLINEYQAHEDDDNFTILHLTIITQTPYNNNNNNNQQIESQEIIKTKHNETEIKEIETTTQRTPTDDLEDDQAFFNMMNNVTDDIIESNDILTTQKPSEPPPSSYTSLASQIQRDKETKIISQNENEPQIGITYPKLSKPKPNVVPSMNNYGVDEEKKEEVIIDIQSEQKQSENKEELKVNIDSMDEIIKYHETMMKWIANKDCVIRLDLNMIDSELLIEVITCLNDIIIENKEISNTQKLNFWQKYAELCLIQSNIRKCIKLKIGIIPKLYASFNQNVFDLQMIQHYVKLVSIINEYNQYLQNNDQENMDKLLHLCSPNQLQMNVSQNMMPINPSSSKKNKKSKRPKPPQNNNIPPQIQRQISSDVVKISQQHGPFVQIQNMNKQKEDLKDNNDVQEEEEEENDDDKEEEIDGISQSHRIYLLSPYKCNQVYVCLCAVSDGMFIILLILK